MKRRGSQLTTMSCLPEQIAVEGKTEGRKRLSQSENWLPRSGAAHRGRGEEGVHPASSRGPLPPSGDESRRQTVITILFRFLSTRLPISSCQATKYLPPYKNDVQYMTSYQSFLSSLGDTLRSS